MTRLRAWIRSFFGFSRTETNAFLILLPLMVILLFLEPSYRYWSVHQPQDFTKEKKELDSLIKAWKWDEPDSSVRITRESPEENLTAFNPNSASTEELMALGFTKTLAKRIV